MTYILYKIYPKKTLVGQCKVALYENGQGFAWDCKSGACLAELARARVEVMSKDGLVITGFDTARNGKHYRYQKWWLEYPKE